MIEDFVDTDHIAGELFVLLYFNKFENIFLFRHRHVRRVLCTNYLAGFCPDGELCKYMHPRFELPPAPEIPKDQIKRPPTCHFCGELGHKAVHCQKMPPEVIRVI